MPILENCRIKFYTNEAGKGAETEVFVGVRDDNDVIAAFVSDDFGDFEQHSDNGPFDLAIRNASEKVNLRGGSLHIGFYPKEEDIWRFNFFLFLSFTDGTRLNGGRVGVELNRDQREQTFRLNEIAR